MYSYGWREYMPDIGRWNGMDQLSESYHAASPYAYVLNNPINRYDPDGMRVRPVSGGYEFTGSDIGELSSYLGSGGNYRSLINSLSAWEGGGMGGSFWSFSGSYNAWGGSGDAGGNIYTTTAGNGAAGGSQNQIQEIIWTRTKMGSAQSSDEWKTEAAKAARQPGRAMMMGGFLDFMGLADIAGAYIENNVSPENQRTGALGLFAVALALKKPGLIAKDIKTTYSVYHGLEEGAVKYVGITSRDPALRFAEHQAAGGSKSLLRFEAIEGATGLTRREARIMEQNLINQYGLQKNGGQLLNKINSIAPYKWWIYGIK